MSGEDLEGPSSAASLYLARGGDVQNFRPIFTGDVFEGIAVLEESGDREIKALILQHPCALRTNGVDLSSRLLVAEVVERGAISPGGWRGSYKIMPLPELEEDSRTFAVSFLEPHVIASESLAIEKRIACLSQNGVNLLLQRWVHHNSRAVVSTALYQEVTAAQFEEADLIEEWCSERSETNEDIRQESACAHEWLRGDSSEAGKSWQQLLEDTQTRSTVRKAMRNHLKKLN